MEVMHFLSIYSFSTTPVVGLEISIPSNIEWVAVTFGIDIHGPQRIKPTDFDDPLT